MSTAPFDPRLHHSANGTGPSSGTTARQSERSQGRWRRLRLIAVVGLAVLTAVAAFLYDPRKLWDDDVTAAETLRDTAVASTSTLTATHEANGDIVYARPLDITAEGGSGIVTEMVQAEDTIRRGDVLWRVVDEPVVALFGDVPASRSLAAGSAGPDVHQLEENLVALGYDTAGELTVDDEYTAYTEVVVARWQEDIGAEATGVIEDGAVVFLPGTSRVGATAVDVGDALAPGATVLTATDQRRLVEFSVPAAERDTIAIGDSVSLRLPDRSTVTADVTALLFRNDGGIDVWADPLESIDYAVDTVPVTVSWSVPIGDEVLTVPAGALIRTDDGSYNVEVRRTTGVEELVPVEVGLTSGVSVEIIGDIADGDVVIAP